MIELLDRLADPLVWALFLLLAAMCWALVRRLKGLFALLLAAFLLLWGLGSGPGAALLLRPLEGRYPALLAPPSDEAVKVVVLTGGEGWAEGRPITSDLSTSTGERLLEAVRVWRLLGEGLPLLFVGGVGTPGRPAEAPLVAQAARALGVPGELIEWEAASRNTYENALAIRDRVGTRPFVLVTSAFHMPRAMAVCRRVGLRPIPAPCGYRARGGYSALDLIPDSIYLGDSALAIREYFAFVLYRLRDWI